ncbi:hypothetical protein OSB04_025737 [Centaurea solstitialis]|uniref:Uncharacterized protein n=1 Tax=Centaurea solstitialis TaxID=347529 RepID=A0AA38SNM0_9ASTR|nr:hypothetical protein OSB04_025737 [Centaurea solstitialis]
MEYLHVDDESQPGGNPVALVRAEHSGAVHETVNPEPVEWNELLAKFGLWDESWFQHMFYIRDSWIAFHTKHLPMLG